MRGLDLCAAFFQEIAQPILIANFPSLRYAAGLLGSGSDVLGFDDALSTDHNWGPRFTLFLPEEHFEERKTHIMAAFAADFPYEYKGFSVHFSTPDSGLQQTRGLTKVDRYARQSLASSAGVIPAPARGGATSPGIESWAYGGNNMSQV
jgi:hypothetical protein